MKEEMTSRERVLAGLRHQPTDRIPFSLGFGVNDPAKRELAAYLGLAGVAEADRYLRGLDDIASVEPDYIGPRDRHVTDGAGIETDIWGVVRKPMSYGAGHYDEISYYPLAGVEDIGGLDDHLWPSADWVDPQSLRVNIARAKREKDYAIRLGNGNIFERSWYMRGFQQMLMDLVLNPELAWAILTRVTDYFVAYFTTLLQAADGMVDLVFTADDIGQQQGLLMSLGLWEKMIKPHHARLNKVLHEFGVKVLYHTDGAVMEAVPGLIDMGIDILEALQFDAQGMDPVRLKANFGDRLCFHGGVSVQSTLPFGSPEDVRREVEERIRVLGAGGGYILAPSHAIQAGTPPQNIVAFLEAANRR